MNKMRICRYWFFSECDSIPGDPAKNENWEVIGNLSVVKDEHPHDDCFYSKDTSTTARTGAGDTNLIYRITHRKWPHWPDFRIDCFIKAKPANTTGAYEPCLQGYPADSSIYAAGGIGYGTDDGWWWVKGRPSYVFNGSKYGNWIFCTRLCLNHCICQRGHPNHGIYLAYMFYKFNTYAAYQAEHARDHASCWYGKEFYATAWLGSLGEEWLDKVGIREADGYDAYNQKGGNTPTFVPQSKVYEHIHTEGRGKEMGVMSVGGVM